MASAGSTLFLIYALVQTALGRSRFDTVPATAALFVVSLVCLGVPAVATAWAWLVRRRVTAGGWRLGP
jgi:hypothetical protein